MNFITHFMSIQGNGPLPPHVLMVACAVVTALCLVVVSRGNPSPYER